MRKILFRGKCNEIGKYNGQWIEGFYAVDDGKPLIAHSTNNGLNGYFCEPGSIGEYTGMQDKTGKMIFDGDIVKGCWDTVFEVYFDEDYLQYRARKADGSSREIDYYGDSDKLEVIGNMYDTPDLIRSSK